MSPEKISLRTMASVTQFSLKYKYWVLALAFIGAGVCTWLTILNAKINTNTEDMISSTVPWRIAQTTFKKDFPLFSDTIVIVVDGPTPDLTDEAAEHLVSKLTDMGLISKQIFYLQNHVFFRENKFLYLSLKEIETLSKRLTTSQAMLGRLAANPDLNGLLALTNEINERSNEMGNLESQKFIITLAEVLERSEDSSIPMSWQDLLGGEPSLLKTHRRLIVIKPTLDFSQILPANKIMSELQELISRFEPDIWPEIAIRLTGPAALGHDELNSVIDGAKQAAVLSLILIIVVLLVGLRSLSLLLAVLFTLLTGLAFTAAFATVAIGTLNMISIAFAVLYVGLGADFAIHYCLRFQEESRFQSKLGAITASARHGVVPLGLCALTSAVGFLAFIPTDYKGVGELGMIAGVGMLISFFMSFTVLPACLSALPVKKNKKLLGNPEEPTKNNMTKTSSNYFMGALVVIAFTGLYISNNISFDINPLHLNNPDAESVKTLHEMSLAKESPLEEIAFVVNDMSTALKMKERLSKVSEAGAVTLISSFIPQEQASKLSIINELQLVLGGEFQIPEGIKIPSLNLDALKVNLMQNIKTINEHPAPSEGLLRYKVQLQKVLSNVSQADYHQSLKYAQEIEMLTMRHFSQLIKKINDGLSPNVVSFENLPDVLKNQWVTKEGRIRLQINPKESLDSNEKISNFVSAIRDVTGQSATGVPIVSLEASRSVITSFTQAFVTACLVIIGVLWMSLKEPFYVGIALIPMLLACVATTSIMVLLGLSFNFANIIALPLIIGIGVDSTLHIIHRHINNGGLSINFMQTSTARGVILSTMTTMASFGNLAISPHAGTASMGLLLSLGMTITLISTLGCLPLLLRMYVKRGIEIAK
jgi:uncharacterized protein